MLHTSTASASQRSSVAWVTVDNCAAPSATQMPRISCTFRIIPYVLLHALLSPLFNVFSNFVLNTDIVPAGNLDYLQTCYEGNEQL